MQWCADCGESVRALPRFAFQLLLAAHDLCPVHILHTGPSTMGEWTTRRQPQQLRPTTTPQQQQLGPPRPPLQQQLRQGAAPPELPPPPPQQQALPQHLLLPLQPRRVLVRPPPRPTRRPTTRRPRSTPCWRRTTGTAVHSVIQPYCMDVLTDGVATAWLATSSVNVH